jgi:predicted hydrocarbon binding protein
MNIVEQNIVKFVDSLIVDDFSTAHTFLEKVINEKIKVTIAEAAKKNPFKKDKKDKKDKTSNLKPFKKKDRNEKAEKDAEKKSAFGGGKFPQAKRKKLKESVESETLYLRSIFDSDLFSKMKELFRRSCHGGNSNTRFMETAYTLGKVDMEHWGDLLDEIQGCIMSCKDSSDKAYLKEIHEKIKEAGTKMYEDKEEFERDMPRYNTETLGDDTNVR